MEACIFTGHPAWKDGLNQETEALWKELLQEMPAISSYRLYNVHGLTPVSYTHLDVYKRQRIYTTVFPIPYF